METLRKVILSCVFAFIANTLFAQSRLYCEVISIPKPDGIHFKNSIDFGLTMKDSNLKSQVENTELNSDMINLMAGNHYLLVDTYTVIYQTPEKVLTTAVHFIFKSH